MIRRWLLRFLGVEDTIRAHEQALLRVEATNAELLRQLADVTRMLAEARDPGVVRRLEHKPAPKMDGPPPPPDPSGWGAFR